MATSLGTLLDGAIATLESLGALGEDVEDEWTYVTDLVAAQRLRLEAVVERRGHEPATDAAVRAVELAAEEVGLITDPHRAIDWLSTFPELVALAVGEPVGGAPDGGTPAGVEPSGGAPSGGAPVAGRAAGG